MNALRKHGVNVHERSITPWRFDTARNFALDLIPSDADICVSLDMDEVFSAGWRQAIERIWQPETTQLSYLDVRTWSREGHPERIIRGFKIHNRHDYRWQYAIHEILVTNKPENVVFTSEIEVRHFPDFKKDRKSYLKILEEQLRLDPENSYYYYYWALETISQGDLEKSIQALNSFVQMFPYEESVRRSNAYRLSAWCRKKLNQAPAIIYQDLLAAVTETPDQRESWANLATFAGERGTWLQAYEFTLEALRCVDQAQSLPIDPSLWDGKLEKMADAASANLYKATAQVL